MLRFNNCYFLVIKILLFLTFLQTLLFWPALYYNNFLITLASFCILVFYVKKNKIWIGNFPLVIYSFICLSFYIIIYNGIQGCGSIIISYLITTLLIHLSYIKKQEILNFITKFFGILISISLFFYLIHIIYPFGYFNVLKAPWGYVDHFNYIAYITPSIFPDRFSGPFIEPGHLSMASVFLIYANNFNFKTQKYLWPILVGILFSLSLAGYILIILAFFLSQKNNLKIFSIFLLLTSCSFVYVKYIWDTGNNPVNILILNRLEYDDEKGIVGNNRSQGNTDLYWSRSWRNGEIILGNNSESMMQLTQNGEIEGSGYKIYIIRYGLLGTLFTLLYYFSIVFYAVNKKTAFKFLLFIAICFIQRAYPYWISWLIPFVCSLKMKNKKLLK